MSRRRAHFLSLACLLAAVFAAAPVRAASLQKVSASDWGIQGLPSYVNMYIYVPDKQAVKPPILVGSHHCGGTGPGTYSEMSSLVSLADKTGFIMIFPEATGHNCWDVGSSKSLRHDGGGDTHAIAQMVRYTLAKYGGDVGRVYAFGGSSGAMMTQALMGIYPDLFTAGVAVSGVPCGCWSAAYTGDTGPNPQWSGPCAGGQVSKTASQWGDLVRSMFPGYSGPRPRLQLWHGTADTTISPKNLTESVKEWTNVLGLAATPTKSDTPKTNTTRQVWSSSCGNTELETWSVQGAGHGVNWDLNSVVGFLGLDIVGDADPEATACPVADAGEPHGDGDAGRAGDAARTSDNGPDADGGVDRGGVQAGGAASGADGSLEPTGGKADAGSARSTPANSHPDATVSDDHADSDRARGGVRGTGDGDAASDAGGCAVANRFAADSMTLLFAIVGCVLRARRRRFRSRAQAV